jgi:cytidylate kinase
MVGYLSVKLKTKDFLKIKQEIEKQEISFSYQNDSSSISLFLDEENISSFIRNEDVAKSASEFATIPEVRNFLFSIQRSFSFKGPGLIADGRDMGTVVFPEAKWKFFLTASVEERARRRENQLKESGLSVNMPNLLQSIKERDNKDSSRKLSPLMPAEDALVIDSSEIGIVELKQKVLKIIRE